MLSKLYSGDIFTQGKTIVKAYTTMAREPSIHVTEFPYETKDSI